MRSVPLSHSQIQESRISFKRSASVQSESRRRRKGVRRTFSEEGIVDMQTKALVIEQHAISVLRSAILKNDWFNQFGLPKHARGLRRVEIENNVYILSDKADKDSRLLVILVGGLEGVFRKARSPKRLFERIIHMALAQFERTVSVPLSWAAYNQASLISIYAQPESLGGNQRIYLDRSPQQTNHLYAYALTNEAEYFMNVSIDETVFLNAFYAYFSALNEPVVEKESSEGTFGIVFTEPLGAALIGARNINEMYQNRLTRDQRRFVDSPHNGPVRLKGVAGSGKTLAMAVKCLRDLYRFEDEGRDARVAFLTHSSALAQDYVAGMFNALDRSRRWTELQYSAIFLGSIYELAKDLQQYEIKNLKPLSTDGREGREWQIILIDDAINECLKDDRFILQELNVCEPGFIDRITNPSGRSTLIEELINEFACVLTAENVRKGNDKAQEYCKKKREKWQMNLSTELERRVIVTVHDKYFSSLEQQKVLSMDQMIADFNNYLSRHEWRQLRERHGFDLIFVDEFHYFNRAECEVFHSLFRNKITSIEPPPLFMAYDFKQSPNDAFRTQNRMNQGRMFRSVGVGAAQEFNLNQVFRSTPQIANFLRDLDRCFPAFDLEGELGVYLGNSEQEGGDVPTLKLCDTNMKLLDTVFAEATSLARDLGGRHVAILCMNDQLYAQYLSAGRIERKFTALQSRDELAQLQYAGKRPIFSTPDYVSGLQFHTVYLMHIDRTEIDAYRDNPGIRRRFVSRCYAGASRAMKQLFIFSSEERGGVADILSVPLQNKTLVKEQ